MKPRGKSTEAIIKRHLTAIIETKPCMSVIRLFDTYSARGNTLPDRPADFIVICRQGKVVFFEVKESRFEKGFKFSVIRPAQEKAMRVCSLYNIPYYLIIRQYTTNRYFIIPAPVVIQKIDKVNVYKIEKEYHPQKDMKKMLISYYPYSELEKYMYRPTEVFFALDNIISEIIKKERRNRE